MKIYGAILSPFVRKVLAVCKLKGLDFEHEAVMPGTKTPEFLAMSPLGKIPAFSDGDLTVSDSRVICEYLEEKYPDTPVLPATAELRARARWYEEYSNSVVTPRFAVFFFERLIKPMMGLGDTDEALLAALIADEHPAILDYLESQLPADGFLFGDALGVADIALASPFFNASYAGYEPDMSGHPLLAGWLARLKSHPVMSELLAAEADLLKAMQG